MEKFVLRVRPVKKSDSGVNRTTEYRRRLKAENPERHAAAKEKDAQKKSKTKEWQFKGSTDKEETRESDADSEAEKVSWKKESKKGITNQTEFISCICIYLCIATIFVTDTT